MEAATWLISFETQNMLQESYFYAVRFGWMEVLHGKLLWYIILHKYPFRHMNYTSGTYPPHTHYHGSLVQFHCLTEIQSFPFHNGGNNTPERAGFIWLPCSKFFPNKRTLTAVINVPKYNIKDDKLPFSSGNANSLSVLLNTHVFL